MSAVERYRRSRRISILDAMEDEHLFAAHFKDTKTWAAWRAFLCALFALTMTDDELATYRKHTGRTSPPTEPSHEAWLVCGRRAGKSFILATIAVFLAVARDWRRYLGPGEVGTVMLIARDRRQARVLKRYVHGLLHASEMLRRLIEREDAEGITLSNRVVVEIHTASFRSTRGYTLVAALCDEIAFWPSDENSSEPDFEVINALRPGMSTIPGAMLLCASSPYSRRGALWDAHRRHYGKDGPILVWQAPTRAMNPSVRQSIIDEAMERDPASAASEYGAQFRSDIETFISREIVQACVSTGSYERPPVPGVSYQAFIDPSGGSGTDSMTMGIAHRDGNTVVIDCLREVRPPFSPEQVVEDFAKCLKSYHVYRIEGDRYAGEWPREQLRKAGIAYQVATKPKSELYAHHLLPTLNSGRLDLLDHARCNAQIIGLERRTARGGKESIDHTPGAHDDLANCIAGLVARVGGGGGYVWQVHEPGRDWIGGGGNEKPQDDPKEQQKRVRALIAKLKRGEPV